MFGQNPYSAGAVPSEGQGEGKEGDPLQMGVILLWQGTGQGLGLGVPAGPETLRRDRVKRNTRAGGFCRTGGGSGWGGHRHSLPTACSVLAVFLLCASWDFPSTLTEALHTQTVASRTHGFC